MSHNLRLYVKLEGNNRRCSLLPVLKWRMWNYFRVGFLIFCLISSTLSDASGLLISFWIQTEGNPGDHSFSFLLISSLFSFILTILWPTHFEIITFPKNVDYILTSSYNLRIISLFKIPEYVCPLNVGSLFLLVTPLWSFQNRLTMSPWVLITIWWLWPPLHVLTL